MWVLIGRLRESPAPYCLICLFVLSSARTYKSPSLKFYTMQIYIGNLSEMTTAYQLARLFLPFGAVQLSHIERDEKTGRSLRCGFIEMDTPHAKSAIEKLNHILFMNAYVEVGSF